MKNFIENILNFKCIGKYVNEECVFINKDFIVVKDIKMVSDNLEHMHFTAWCRDKKINSLKDINIDNVKILIKIKNEMDKYIRNKYNGFDDYDIFIHYPPQFYQLHIHFLNRNIKKHSLKEEIFYLDDVIEYFLDEIKNKL
tara:strand:- start:173 stop:595 length:423 start_codon:yes stop_codon:yes gene_type:complete